MDKKLVVSMMLSQPSSDLDVDESTPLEPQGIGSWVHETPSKSLCNLQTGRVHYMLRRGRELIVFQGELSKEHRLYAKRGRWSSRIKFIILDANMTPVGWLRQVKSNFSCHSYELTMAVVPSLAETATNDAETPVAVITYKVPSLREFISKISPRIARVALFPYDEETVTNELPVPGRDEPTRRKCIVLESKAPYLKPNGRRGLDFAGRGSGSSTKNMQLVQTADNGKSTIVLQMAKWQATGKVNRLSPVLGKEKLYHVDFAASVTPFQAFGVALAQLDL